MNDSIITSFLDYAFNTYGMVFADEIVADGTQKRYKMDHDSGNAKSGWLTMYIDDNPMAIFGDWKQHNGEVLKWFYRDQNSLTKKEIDDHKKRMFKAKELRDNQKKELEQAAAIKAGELYFSNNDIDLKNYQYLQTKKVGNYGVKFFSNDFIYPIFYDKESTSSGVSMIVPLQNAAGQLTSLQLINPSGSFKGFIPNGVKKGCFHLMRGDNRYIFVAEGYSTAATIYEATGCTTFVAFDSGNLCHVSKLIIQAYADSTLIIASDDDRFNELNTGQLKATEITDITEFKNMKPLFLENDNGTDFNDMMIKYGMDHLKKFIRNYIKSVITGKL